MIGLLFGPGVSWSIGFQEILGFIFAEIYFEEECEREDRFYSSKSRGNAEECWRILHPKECKIRQHSWMSISLDMYLFGFVESQPIISKCCCLHI
ncbi:hypothetical protein CEXT_685571 [Caerostris extrusa]|uniref:Uncharacterized protein n=1 Tax=Caerostris extrusa TaxID=172846 RepID=A0AAV4RXL1_CAEEX|nr:hypothetical protein CEXT_685571 [Caerostris extrusa]